MKKPYETPTFTTREILSIVTAGATPISGMGGDGDLIESDVRLKTDIKQVGSTVYGLPVYQFRYITGSDRFEGVMAQDVLEVRPDAVVIGDDGFYRVNYAKLGISICRL